MEDRDYQPGETFELDGKKYICKEEINGCDGCAFDSNHSYCCASPDCSPAMFVNLIFIEA